MQALLLTREYPPQVYGGAGVHVMYLARELAKRIPVEVRTFGEQALDAGQLRVRGHGFAWAAPEDVPLPFLPALRALRVSVSFAARPIQADLVHCHTWYAAFGGLLARLCYGIPLIVTAHSLEPLRPWKREQLGRGSDLAAWTERQALESADAVVAVSHEMRGDLLRLFRLAPERVVVIHNGVDIEEYRPVADHSALRRYGLDLARPYVLFVGRISRQKGILHLLHTLPRLDPAAQLVLCASSPDTPELEKELEEAVGRAQATRGGVVWIREMLSRPEVVQLYSHAAVFCCPSIYEPFGIINLEAMACQVPVVASAVGGIPEVVVDGETGLLVPVAQAAEGVFEPRDPDGFAQALSAAINRLLADPARRAAMGQAGRRRAETQFSWAVIADRTLALYRSLASRAAGQDHAG